MKKDKTLTTKPPKGAPGNPVQLTTPAFRTEAEEAAWWDEHSERVTDLLIKYGRPTRALAQNERTGTAQLGEFNRPDTDQAPPEPRP
jgi:hypothetical protein